MQEGKHEQGIIPAYGELQTILGDDARMEINSTAFGGCTIQVEQTSEGIKLILKAGDYTTNVTEFLVTPTTTRESSYIVVGDFPKQEIPTRIKFASVLAELKAAIAEHR